MQRGGGGEEQPFAAADFQFEGRAAFEGAVDEVPLVRLVGPGACVDVSAKCAVDRNYQVTVEDLRDWEAANNASLEDRIALIRTGFGRYWPDREKYLGTSETGRAAASLTTVLAVQVEVEPLEPPLERPDDAILIDRRQAAFPGMKTARDHDCRSAASSRSAYAWVGSASVGLGYPRTTTASVASGRNRPATAIAVSTRVGPKTRSVL